MSLDTDRNSRWGAGLSLSHRMIFIVATTGIVGTYALLVVAGAYYLNMLGGEFGRVAQLLFIAAAVLVLLLLLASETARSKFRVFVQKHFQHYKYDYRHEWLRFTHALSRAAGEADILETSIRAIADIVDSPGGLMWVLDDSRNRYVLAASAPDKPGDEMPVPADDRFAEFLAKRGWIISLHDFRADPRRYEGLTVPDRLLARQEAWLVIPLLHGPTLIGFVVLDRPAVLPGLNFEDHDLLKTVGRDVATHISQFEVSRRLAENRQFSAYHQLSTFVIHDLKNLIAQLSLVVRNAEKHRRNPEFVDDSIETIANSVDRMTRLIGQLSKSAHPVSLRSISLGTMLDGVVKRCREKAPEPRLVLKGHDIEVLADPERLSSALEHLVRNAQDATTPAGSVVVTLTDDDPWARIAVSDDGVGMDADFVRGCLFRPFNTTKGQAGMGIGAYQSREYVRSLGGEIHVQSAPDRGTTLEIRLPTAREPGSEQGREERAGWKRRAV